MTALTRKRSTISGGTLLALLISSTMFLASAGVFYAWSAWQVSVAAGQHQAAEQKFRDKEQLAKEASDRAAAERLEQWQRDNALRSQGYQAFPGGIYYKDSASSECVGNSRCAVYTIKTADPCLSGVAMTVEMYKGFVSLGTVLGVTPGLPEDGVADVSVDLLAEADMVAVKDARCIG